MIMVIGIDLFFTNINKIKHNRATNLALAKFVIILNMVAMLLIKLDQHLNHCQYGQSKIY